VAGAIHASCTDLALLADQRLRGTPPALLDQPSAHCPEVTFCSRAETAATGQAGSSRSSQCMIPATLPSVPLTASNRAAMSGPASGARAAYRCRVRSCTMATA